MFSNRTINNVGTFHKRDHRCMQHNESCRHQFDHFIKPDHSARTPGSREPDSAPGDPQGLVTKPGIFRQPLLPALLPGQGQLHIDVTEIKIQRSSLLKIFH
ncbi:hypothetical protein M8J76_010549 [Diaphorina citri]|nr:hypothetical protein M8J76_010549 [Diaphorina citri]KAI5750862.1 hypothetical protein M8J77_001880 [Diaphorina citri]